MNKMIYAAAIAAGLGLGATLVGWRVHASHIRPAVQFEIVKDRSGPTTDGCQTVIGLAENALNADDVSPKSTLTVLLLGDAATAYEPTLLGSYQIPFSTKVIEGRGAIRQRRNQVLRDLLLKCRASRTTDISPIFLAVKQAIADLRGKGCDAISQCHLAVDTDLEENVETAIRSRLNGASGKTLQMPAPINNSNITVLFCGLAATSGATMDSSGRSIHRFPMRDPAREDRLKATWSVFSAPELVTFLPYCPVPDYLTQHNAEASSGSQN